jgi:uncharacterized protein (TIGR03437 family)
VTVTIDGRAATVYYISPSQLNVCQPSRLPRPSAFPPHAQVASILALAWRRYDT